MRLLIHALLLIVVSATIPLASASAQSNERCFAETNFCISGRFRQYWEQNGGLPVFGLPLSPAGPERNRDTGATYQTQYFERGRFELHPENTAPYDVLLGRLGVDLLLRANDEALMWPETNPNAPGYTDPQTPYYFLATGFAIDPAFTEYWTTHGLDLGDPGISQRESLALFGAPVSRAYVVVNPDGDEVYAQVFERARFEQHNGIGVLLGRLTANLQAYNQPATNGYVALGERVINPQNGASWRVDCHDGVWSPNGQRLACPFKLVSYDGTGAVPLNDVAITPSWSPDSRQVAFTTANNDLFVMYDDGFNLRRLTNTPDIDGSPQWSPDGTRIMFDSFSSESHIFAIDPDGSNQQQLTAEDGSDAHWSPDGSRIVFATKRAGNTDIYVMNADGTNQRALTSDPLEELAPRWSPDGRYISFEKVQNNQPGSERDVYIMNADGTNQRALGATPVSEEIVQWSPDSTRLMFYRFNGVSNLQIVVSNADGSGETVVASGINSAWSPDSTQIAYVADERVANFTYLINADGSNKRVIARGVNIAVAWASR